MQIFKFKTSKDSNSALDYKFYRFHYSDLNSLKTNRSLRAHYERYGKAEGRLANLDELLRTLTDTYGSLPPDFDLGAYKIFNEDLRPHFHADSHYIEHFLKYGRAENRPYSFGSASGRRIRAAWEPLFSTAQFVAWAGDSLPEIPASRDEAIDAFKEYGIPNLCPVNLEYIFDPIFYRSYYNLGNKLNDVELYRDWLEKGVAKGRFPNESRALAEFIGDQEYPNSFRWKEYAKGHSVGAKNRVNALRHLFAQGFSKPASMKFISEDGVDLLFALGKFHLIRGNLPLAKRAFSEATKRGLDLWECWQLLGDVHLRMDNDEDALPCYGKACNLPGCSVWAVIHAAKIFSRRTQYDRAFDLLRLHKAKFAGDSNFLSAIREVIDSYFDHISGNVKSILRENIFGAAKARCLFAHTMMTDALSQITDLIIDFENLPPCEAKCDGQHVAILANKDLRQCTHYRVEQKGMIFESADIDCVITPHQNTNDFVSTLPNARAAIFYRVAAFPSIIRAILSARAMGIDTYYEVDDLIFDRDHYPDSFASYEGQISEEDYVGLQYGTSLFDFALRLCDYGIASTTTLRDEMAKRVRKGRALIIPNGLDTRNEVAIFLGSKPAAPREAIKIFYGSGTKAHNADFNVLAGPALVKVMEADSRVTLVIVGFLKLSRIFDTVLDRVTFIPLIDNVEEYWSVLSGCDINLAVLNSGIMSDAKSEIKWLEAAVLRIPSIVSNTKTYRDVCEDGVDVLIAADEKDWASQISRLVADGDLRRRIGACARLKALEKFNTGTLSEIIKGEFAKNSNAKSDVAATSRQSVSGGKKIRVLVCNVFFSPQSIGGATRVVEDNLKHLLARYGSQLELIVLASDDGRSPAGLLRFDVTNGIPVYRLSTPVEVDMDWRPFNKSNESLFSDLLKFLKPDLVHFHCMQRLTASAVEIAYKLRVPYIVTLHDAWWISDYQFLVNEDGRLCMPHADAIADAQISKRGAASVSRRQRLAGLLASAERRLSVSEAFTKIYEAAGIENIETVANGLSSVGQLKKMPHQRGIVSLGHIGGRAAHKGAFLIEAVLRRGEFSNLRLTMVDGRLARGQSRDVVWGKTQVRLTGPYPQDEVSQLYADLDVLLAPSTWPESFGLVTREAQDLGIWVVASDLGAIGEGVIEDENGFIIDVTDSSGLRSVLARINNDPNRYCAAPAARSQSRKSSEQADELFEIYVSIVAESLKP